MSIVARQVHPTSLLSLRTRYREEAACQIVHDSIHRREGWTESYLLEADGIAAGFASVAMAGPWKGRPTAFEFYLLPEYRSEAFSAFDAFLAVGGVRHYEVQSCDTLLTVMLHVHGRNVATEKIVFRDRTTTRHAFPDAELRATTAVSEVHRAIDARQGGGEWIVEVAGVTAGKGGLLFHYNRPYADVYMEIAEPFRRQGLGAFLVQELKQLAYGFGAVPAARCNPTNTASRRTLVRAGFEPSGVILLADLASAFPD
ncbi:MAG: GNAT family N-acetyltransferase [Verrucomicrobiales bacterium]|nr:GNAT family N-acetyltransferase [Verrucomicrobiales bacterium]